MTAQPDEVMRYLCGGISINGQPCGHKSPVAQGTKPGNCHKHVTQPIREVPTCLFNEQHPNVPVWKQFRRCGNAAVSIPTEPHRLPCCSAHRHKTPLRRTCTALAVSGIGQSSQCGRDFDWMPPFRELCSLHLEPNHDLPTPISRLPTEVLHMVISHLRPVDRVAFALSRKVYRDRTMEWTGKRRNVTSGRKLEILHHRFRTDQLPDARTHWMSPNSSSTRSRTGGIIVPQCSLETCDGLMYSLLEPPYIKRESGYFDPFTRAVRNCPFLFGSSTSRLCVACHQPLGAAFADHHQRRYFLCQDCCSQCSLYVKRWCKKCDGEMDEYVLSRLYWLCQSKGPQEDRSLWYYGRTEARPNKPRLRW